MGQIDNLGSNPEFKDLLRRIRNLETKPQLGNTAVSRGSTVFKGLLSLIVEGSAQVTGLLTIVGNLVLTGIYTATGTMNMNGPVNIAGTQTVTGVLNVNGPWNLAGTGGITGNVSSTGSWTQTGPWNLSGTGNITGNLNILGGGQIVAGGLTITAAGDLTSTSNLVITAPSVRIVNAFVAAGSIRNSGIATTTAAANMGINVTTKEFLQVTSAARFKIDPQQMDLPDSLLEVPFESWVDLHAAERYAELLSSPRPFTEMEQAEYEEPRSLHRVPGFIAEKVEAAGGSSFVGYGDDGQIQSVFYDRFAGARTAVAARQIADLRAEVAELKAMVERLAG